MKQPICVNADERYNDAPAKADVTEMQLMLDNYDAYRPLLDHDVQITGKLMSAFTGHHHTSLLLQVQEMKAAD